MVHVLSMSPIHGKANPSGPLLYMINKEMKKLAMIFPLSLSFVFVEIQIVPKNSRLSLYKYKPMGDMPRVGFA
jgi:hypothetical protein